MKDERKDIFIETVEALLSKNTEVFIPQEALDFFEDYKKGKSSNKQIVTDKGAIILKELGKVDDWISAKSLGEQMGISGRSIATSMRKLCTDGFVEKQGTSPISYKITEAGKEILTDIPTQDVDI